MRHLRTQRPSALPEAAFASEAITSDEVADGVWSLLFYSIELGRFDERDYQLKT